MIIKHVSLNDNNGPIIDTDKLPDIEALILEKSEELRKLCHNNNRQCLILADVKGSRDGKFVSFWNLVESNKAIIQDNGQLADDQETRIYHAHFYAGIDAFVRGFSNNQIIVIPLSKLKIVEE